MSSALAEPCLELLASQGFHILRQASQWLVKHGESHGVPAEQFDSLDLFLNEALANVLDHGGPRAIAMPINVHFDFRRLSPQCEATVTVVDAGTAFNPLTVAPKAQPQSLDEAVPGGLGIHLMRSFADDLHYSYRDDHNHLSFTVRWEPPDNHAEDHAIQVQHFGRKSDRRSSNVKVAVDRRSAQSGRRNRGLNWLPLFRDADEKAIDAFITDSEVLLLSAGTPLLRPGDANKSVFVLLSGHLAAYLDNNLNPENAIQIGPGECIGELSAIDGKPVSALVLAVDDVRILKLTPEMFWNRLLLIPGIARNLLITLTERMRRTNETVLEKQRKQLELEHLRKELEVARQLQASMLPLQRPMFPDRDDMEISAIMEPTSEVGGDLFDAFFIDNDHLFICIGDVSGHGIPAALFMARSIGLMHITAMNTMQPDELITRLNDQLCEGNDTNLFVTLFCAFLNVKTWRLVYSNGGHCAPIVLSGGKVSLLPIPKGALVGAIPGQAYSSMELQLNPGDMLVCFTDGVTEAQLPSGEEFTEERLVHLVEEMADSASLDEMLESIHHHVIDFTGSDILDDDCTLLVVRRPAE